MQAAIRTVFQVAALAVALILCTSSIGVLHAQDETANPVSEPADEQLEELEKRNALLEQRIKLVENETKLLEAKYGKAAEPLEGDVTVKGDTPIESIALAYLALEDIAIDMAKAIAEEGAKNVEDAAGLAAVQNHAVIWSAEQVDALLFYQSFTRQLELIKDDYDKFLEPAGRGFLSATALATGVLSSAIEVLSLFRTDREVTSKKLVIGDLALVASLAGRLSSTEHKWKVYYAEKLPPDPNGVKESYLMVLLEGLDEQLREAEKRVKKLTEAKALQAKITKQVKALEAAIAKEKDAIKKKKLETDRLAKDEELKKATEDVALQEALSGPLAGVNAAYVALRATLFESAEDKGAAKLNRLLKAERLVTVLDQENSYILLVSVLEAGGTTSTTKNLFAGSRLRHSGGALASFFLFDNTGAIARSGTFAGHSGQRKFKTW